VLASWEYRSCWWQPGAIKSNSVRLTVTRNGYENYNWSRCKTQRDYRSLWNWSVDWR